MGRRREPRLFVLVPVLLGVHTMTGCAMGFVMAHAGAHAAARRSFLLSLSSTEATVSCTPTTTRRDVIQKLGLIASPILWGTPVLATPTGEKLRGHIRSATRLACLYMSLASLNFSVCLPPDSEQRMGCGGTLGRVDAV